MHIQELKENTHHNCNLQALWNKDGASAFEFKIVELAPEGLSPLQIQRWLVNKEQEIYHHLAINNIAINIAKPEIFTTPDALSEFKQEQDKADKAKNKIITSRIKDIKAILSKNNIETRKLLTAIRHHESEINTVTSIISNNTGLKKYLFGKLSQQQLNEYIIQLECERSKLSSIMPSYNYLVEENTQLRLEMYKLRRSYPKKIKNQVKRNFAKIGIRLNDDKIY